MPLHTRDKGRVYDTDRVTVAIYAKKHGLLDTPGWRLPGLKKIAKTQQRILWHANQAKLHSWLTKNIYMYGVLIPKNYEQAVEFDKQNGNTKWQDCTKLELSRLTTITPSRIKDQIGSQPKTSGRLPCTLPPALLHPPCWDIKLSRNIQRT